MIIPEQVKCNVCGIEKGETNHWLVARVSQSDPVGIAFLPMNEPNAELPSPDVALEHICGHACATKRFSQWLETLTSSTPKGSTE